MDIHLYSHHQMSHPCISQPATPVMSNNNCHYSQVDE